MDLKELGAYLRRPGTHDRLRVETRAWYDSAADDPHFTRWVETGAVEVDSTWQSWLDGIRSNIGSGTCLRRVRVIADEPLNDYLRFELTVQFPLNADAGEQIRILPLPEAQVAAMVDYFVIDQERVAVSHYDDYGRFQYAEGHDEAHPFLDEARRLWDDGVPYAKWFADYNRKQQEN